MPHETPRSAPVALPEQEQVAIKKAKAQLASLTVTINKIKEDVKMAEQAEAARAKAEEGCRVAEQKLTDLRERVSEVKAELESHKGNLEVLIESVTARKGDLRQLDKATAVAKEAMNIANKNLEKVLVEISHAESDLVTVRKKHQKLASEMEEQQEQLDTLVESCAATQEEHVKQIESLQSEAEGVKEEIKTLESERKQAGKLLEAKLLDCREADEKLQELQTGIAAVSGEREELLGAAEAEAEKIIAKAKKEAQTVLELADKSKREQNDREVQLERREQILEAKTRQLREAKAAMEEHFNKPLPNIHI